MLSLTPAQSRARIKKLRAMGYRVKTIKLPDGTKVILKSRQRFTCRTCHHAKA